MALGYGLRYQTQNRMNEHRDFASRLSFSWGLSRGATQPKTVLRAGFGIFYDRLTQSMLLQAEQLNGSTRQQMIVDDPSFYPSVPTLAALTSSAQTVRSAVYRIDPNLTSPYTMQGALGFEHQLAKTATVSVTYLNSRGIHQFLTRNINAPLPGTYDPANPASGVRPYGNIGIFTNMNPRVCSSRTS
jgi:hypothetical protein